MPRHTPPHPPRDKARNPFPTRLSVVRPTVPCAVRLFGLAPPVEGRGCLDSLAVGTMDREHVIYEPAPAAIRLFWNVLRNRPLTTLVYPLKAGSGYIQSEEMRVALPLTALVVSGAATYVYVHLVTASSRATLARLIEWRRIE
jgi:hypothetical protein